MHAYLAAGGKYKKPLSHPDPQQEFVPLAAIVVTLERGVSSQQEDSSKAPVKRINH